MIDEKAIVCSESLIGMLESGDEFIAVHRFNIMPFLFLP